MRQAAHQQLEAELAGSVQFNFVDCAQLLIEMRGSPESASRLFGCLVGDHGLENRLGQDAGHGYRGLRECTSRMTLEHWTAFCRDEQVGWG